MKYGHSVMQKKKISEENKDESGYGDIWTWVAIDADTKLIPSFCVGKRDAKTARGRNRGQRPISIIYYQSYLPPNRYYCLQKQGNGSYQMNQKQFFLR